MKAVLTNFGTRGDIQPFLALAVELRRHGHQPLLAMPPAAAGDASRLGLDFVPVGPDLRSAQETINHSMVAAPSVTDSTAQLLSLFGPLAEALPRMFEDLRAACRGAHVLISGRMQPAARMVHDLTQVPFVSVHVEHSGGTAGGSGGSPAFQEAVRATINPLRTRLGLPPFSNPLVEGNSPQLVLFANSRHVRQAPADWPSHYHLTGYFFLEDEAWAPPADLAAFLEAGAPPVVLTFGSMPSEEPEALAALLLESCERAGRRALLQQGPASLAHLPRADSVWLAGALPHSWLFPRAACVVHHGGAGTTASAFRAGVPQVIIPHAYDQFVWADLAWQLGCAAPPLPRAQLSAARLTEALSTALGTPQARQNAAHLGEKVRAEQGVVRARQLIESLVERVGLAPESPSPSEAVDTAPRRKALLQRRRTLHEDE
ncbi:MAG: glycosyltransferase family 1 protein [Myxococcaceae bacterium]|nr:glycosyltransferase family 1 protein [Myxococcaceae bacterium]